MSYDNTNSGILRANKRREKDTHPTHQGSINIDGKEYWLNAWVNTGKAGGKLDGQRYFSIKARPKDEAPQKQGSDWPMKGAAGSMPAEGTPAANIARNPAPSEDFDDDIPF